MNHLKWMGHSGTILDINRALRSDELSCEVTLVTKDGCTQRAHRFVLSTCSDLMRNVLVDVPQGQECTIMLPDINGILLDSMLSFIYIGETNLPSSSLTEFLEAINMLGIKSAISFECTPNSVNTSLNSTVLSDLTSSNLKLNSGLQITTDDLLEEDGGGGGNVVEKIVPDNALTNEQQPDIEFLDVYNTANDEPKITYSIEHMGGNGGRTEFILTENANTYTITESQPRENKLSNFSNAVVEETGGVDEENDENGDDVSDEDNAPVDDDEEDEEVDDAQMLEEEYNNSEPLIEMSKVSDINDTADVEMATDNDATDAQLLELVKSSIKAKSAKLRQEQAEQRALREQFPIIKIRHNVSKPKNPIELDNLDNAAHAVIYEGLSLQKAADKFHISKTVLWRRVRKEPNYVSTGREKPKLTLAYERLKSGDSLKNISKDLDIPMSTLHRHKVRLSHEGRLPKYLACRRRDSTPKDELKQKLAKAVHACVNEGMSQNHAANLFEIPKSTLWRHLRRRVFGADQTVDNTDDVKKELTLK